VYGDFFDVGIVIFRALNVVPGEWYGGKFPVASLIETYQLNHLTANFVP